jgi:hypothetical protein
MTYTGYEQISVLTNTGASMASIEQLASTIQLTPHKETT